MEKVIILLNSGIILPLTEANTRTVSSCSGSVKMNEDHSQKCVIPLMNMTRIIRKPFNFSAMLRNTDYKVNKDYKDACSFMHEI